MSKKLPTHNDKKSVVTSLKSYQPKFWSGGIIVWIAGFAIIGVVTLLISHAASTSSSIEPENGTASSGISLISDATASGGKAVKFGIPPVTTGTNGVWQEIAPAQLSTDFNNPANNFGFASIVIDPINPAVLYMGTNYQGLWKSSDFGSTWSKINTGSGGQLLDQGRVWTLAIDTFNHTILWATSGYGAGGPLKSTDGGVSWTAINIGSPTQYNDVYSIRLDPNLNNHMLVTSHSPWNIDNTNSGVSESIDGGASWSHHAGPSGSNWGSGVGVWFLDNSHSWLVGSQSGGIWRTTNSGGSWTQVSTESISHGGINALTIIDGAMYLADGTTILKTTDNGATWTTITNGLPAGYYGSIATDGVNLYTAPSFPTANYIDGPWYYLPLSGGTWQALTTSPNTCYTHTNNTKQCNGPSSSVYDATNHIVYSVNFLGGVWKLSR